MSNIRFAKGTAIVLIEDTPRQCDPMTVDYRKRCEAITLTEGAPRHRYVYGISSEEFQRHFSMDNSVCYDVMEKFDHSAGRGRLPGQQQKRKALVVVKAEAEEEEEAVS